VIRPPASSRPWRAIVVIVWSGAGFLLSGCERGRTDPPSPEAAYTRARAVVDRHCVSCHSERPTIPAFPIAPGGFVFDTAPEMRRHAERIRARTVDKTMPLLNKTGMTDEERDILRAWVDAGAKAP
jgi:uncharacterized membrane protein